MTDISLIADILQGISNTTKKSEKEEILREHKDNKLLRDVLNHIFNPYIKTNIAKKKLSKEITIVDITDVPVINNIHEYMDYLSKSTGRDEQIGTVQSFISSYPKELHWLLEAMATKTLKIGATSTTINKAFGEEFIPKFDVMLAEKYIETKKIKGVPKLYEHWKRYVGKRVIVTKKLDGNRVAIFVHLDGRVELFSREGHKLEGFSEIEDAFSTFPKGFVYDGEILAINDEGLNSKDLFQKTSKIVRKKGEKTDVEFYVFDLITIESFQKGEWSETCENRKQALGQLIEKKNNPLIQYVHPMFIGEFDYNTVEILSKKAKDNEEEGIMVQLADAPYECKRTFSILKVKVFESADIRCVDIYEGKSGKNIGRLGGIICDYKGHRVNIGGGFSDELRDKLWDNPELVIGKIVEITYFEEFENEDGELDLRFGQFKTIREDKTEPSYY